MERRTPARVFTRAGAAIGGWNLGGHHWLRQYRWLFGVTPLKAALILDLLKYQHGEIDVRPEHLLWSLLFLRQYGPEEVMASMADTTPKTFREKTWYLVFLIAELNLINWERRKVGAAPWNRCYVTVDGTDFRIEEQFPFRSRWYSHKFHGLGVRYEIAISIATGWICWIHGPFPCGDWPDLRIVRDSLNDALEPGEYYIADKGYYDRFNWAITPTGQDNFSDRVQARLWARHETINRRFKQWRALGSKWRHPIEKHGIAFRAVANIVQLGLMTDERTWHVPYDERRFNNNLSRFLLQGA